MEIADAQRTLSEVDRLRRDTRRALHSDWFANVVIGVFFLGATAVSAVAESATLPIAYWAIGVPVGLALIIASAVRLERRLGAEAPLADPGLAIFAVIVAGVIVVNLLTGSDVAWAYVVAAGWVAIGAVDRDAPMGAAGVALAVIATGLVAVDPATPGLWAQLALALLLIAAGLAARARERA